jgi:hypothetical protein
MCNHPIVDRDLGKSTYLGHAATADDYDFESRFITGILTMVAMPVAAAERLPDIRQAELFHACRKTAYDPEETFEPLQSGHSRSYSMTLVACTRTELGNLMPRDLAAFMLIRRAFVARHTRFIRTPLLLERSGRQARKGT